METAGILDRVRGSSGAELAHADARTVMLERFGQIVLLTLLALAWLWVVVRFL